MKGLFSERPVARAIRRATGIVILLPCLSACAGETGDGGGTGGTGASSGGGGTGGAAGAGTGGNAGAAGVTGGTGGAGGSSGGAGGSSGSGGSGGGSIRWCEPPDVDVSGIDGCAGYDPEANGIPPSSDLDVSSFELGKPTSAGEAYAFAVQVLDGSMTVELWGSNANCGPGLEMLFSTPTPEGDACFDSVPQGTYSHLLLVLRESSESWTMVNHTFCPGVECKLLGGKP